MQFKHPELLYALFLLVIPIIIHLFQLRKFKKIPFTNVAFLKNVTIKTRKSSQIKKWLTLVTRLMLFTAIILAFAQPYFSKNNTLNKKTETVIYLDNSFSMQAKGKNGTLLKRAIQDIIANVPEEEQISIVTNSESFKKTTINTVQNDLLRLSYTSKTSSLTSVLLKSKNLFSKNNNSVKNLIFISDFQNNLGNFKSNNDSLINIYAVKLQPVNTQNITIDSAYISNRTPTKLDLKVTLSNSGSPIDNLPISLFNNGNLIAKTSTALLSESEVTFQIPSNEIFNGEIKINDTHLQFDNTLYFNINTPEKINVLAISETPANFLRRIFTNDEFQFFNFSLKNLNYNSIEKQNLIVLNEIENIPVSLSSVLKTFSANGGSVLIIPNTNATISSYNGLLANYGLNIKDLVNSEKRITNINYSHPLYNNGVFEKRVSNFQYPKVNSFFNLNSNAQSILSFEDNKPFLTTNSGLYLLTAALNKENSNFIYSPLIVPTLYNIAKNSFKTANLYYNIGATNSFDVNTDVPQDGVLTLEKEGQRLIPKQQSFTNKVVITTDETPINAGIYNIINGTQNIKKVSYNHDREESELVYQNIENLDNIEITDSVNAVFETLKSDTKINALWKWFVIFALIMLLTEMLILKYFK